MFNLFSQFAHLFAFGGGRGTFGGPDRATDLVTLGAKVVQFLDYLVTFRGQFGQGVKIGGVLTASLQFGRDAIAVVEQLSKIVQLAVPLGRFV